MTGKEELRNRELVQVSGGNGTYITVTTYEDGTVAAGAGVGRPRIDVYKALFPRRLEAMQAAMKHGGSNGSPAPDNSPCQQDNSKNQGNQQNTQTGSNMMFINNG